MDIGHGAGTANHFEDGRGAVAALPDDAPGKADLKYCSAFLI
jgi:hypothetical protein